MYVSCKILKIKITKIIYKIKLKAHMDEAKTSIISPLKIPLINVQRKVTSRNNRKKL